MPRVTRLVAEPELKAGATQLQKRVHLTTKLYLLSLCPPDAWAQTASAPLQPHKVRLSIIKPLLRVPGPHYVPTSILSFPSQHRLTALVSPSYTGDGTYDPRAGPPCRVSVVTTGWDWPEAWIPAHGRRQGACGETLLPALPRHSAAQIALQKAKQPT